MWSTDCNQYSTSGVTHTRPKYLEQVDSISHDGNTTAIPYTVIPIDITGCGPSAAVGDLERVVP